MLIRPSKQELLESSSYELTRRLGVTNFGDSSIAGTIAKIMAERMDYMWAQIEESVTQSSLLTATGKDLDTLGESKGIFRQEALPNHSIGTIGVTFTNLGSTLTIPVGTTVWCSTRPNSKFSTLYAVTLGTDESADVTIVSEGVGDYYNVLPGEIDRCGLASDSITVTNRYSIYNGSNGETDASYRERIFESLAAQVVGTNESIRQGLSNIPGVRDVKLYPAKRGPGTFDILIIPRSEITTELLSLCALIVEERVSPGIDYRLLTPMPKVLDVLLQVRTTNNTAITDYTKTALENAILYFVDGIESSTVSLEALRAELYRTDSSITSLSVSLWLDGSPIDITAQISLDEGEILTIGTIEVK